MRVEVLRVMGCSFVLRGWLVDEESDCSTLASSAGTGSRWVTAAAVGFSRPGGGGGRQGRRRGAFRAPGAITSPACDLEGVVCTGSGRGAVAAPAAALASSHEPLPPCRARQLYRRACVVREIAFTHRAPPLAVVISPGRGVPRRNLAMCSGPKTCSAW